MEKNEFSYEIKGDDNSIKEIRRKEKFFGMKKSNPTVFPMSIKNLAIEIYCDEDIMKDFEFANINRDSKYVKASKRIWKDLNIELQDVQLFRKPLDKSVFDGKLSREFCSNIMIASPTEIPIKYEDDNLLARSMGMYLELLKYNSVIFQHIVLPKVNKEVNSCIYAHEITHTELDNAGGGISKMTNRETLPIFVELLFGNKIADNGYVTDQLLRHRIAYLGGAIAALINEPGMNFERRISIETYVISIIQAIDLYNKYKDGNDSIKKEFHDGISDIFKGKINVEDMLDHYDSDYKKVDHNVKTLRKQMTIN